MSFLEKIPLSSQKIARCRQIAKSIGKQVASLVQNHSTVGTERAVLRLIGMNQALEQNGLLYPSSNFIVDQLKTAERLTEGALYWVSNALVGTRFSPLELEKKILKGEIHLGTYPKQPKQAVLSLAKRIAKENFESLLKKRKERKKRIAIEKQKDPLKEKRPLKYVIVATGNIYDDVTQAKSAVLDGADAIAVIRSTAQSLLDYVPQGITTEGFGGTYATQANFALMRKELDDLGKKIGKYIRLTNYCSGLCMSEIAALASLEGLDFLLNDAMYGILFRDINPIRTLVDQHFSRLICAVSDIWIMTGEDNYMKTVDAKEIGNQVLASQFINEQLAYNAGLKTQQMSIGHAMEMDPFYEKVILMEIARAQMTRQIFPNAPLKYMCNTKYKTGDVFFSHAVDTIFNFIGSLTNQNILLLGMPTEAVHTPWLQDRSISIRGANYVLEASLEIAKEFGYKKDGFIAHFAQNVLDEAVSLLEKIEKMGFLNAIEKKSFAGVSRKVDKGKGLEGVFSIDRNTYFNPFFKFMGSKI